VTGEGEGAEEGEGVAGESVGPEVEVEVRRVCEEDGGVCEVAVELAGGGEITGV
jgi:hypothetical protein